MVRGPVAASYSASARASVSRCDSSSNGLASGIAEREVAEQETRHPDVFDDVSRAPHYDGWYSVRLEVARHQTDGLMANGTIRDEQRNVGLQLAARGQHGRCVAFLRCALAAIGRHADHVSGQRSDRAECHCILESLHRQPRVRIGRGGVDSIVRDVRDPQIGRRVDRYSIHRIELRTGIVSGAGPLLAETSIEARGRGDQNEARARDARRAHKRNRWERRPLIRRVAERGIVRTRSLHVRDRFTGVLTNRRGHPRP